MCVIILNGPLIQNITQHLQQIYGYDTSIIPQTFHGILCLLGSGPCLKIQRTIWSKIARTEHVLNM